MARSDRKALTYISAYALREAGVAVANSDAIEAMDAADCEAICRQAADSETTAGIRDAELAELDRRILDPGHSGASTLRWFQNRFGPLKKSSFYRYRTELVARQSGIAESAELAKTICDLATEHGAGSVFAAANQRAMQLIFNILMDAKANTLGAEADLNRITKLMTALAQLGRTHYQADLLAAQTQELRNKFQKEAKAAAAKHRNGHDDSPVEFDEAMIEKISEAVFGGRS